jgi:pimeloyl-ACP methyl ester carboxylesterase
VAALHKFKSLIYGLVSLFLVTILLEACGETNSTSPVLTLPSPTAATAVVPPPTPTVPVQAATPTQIQISPTATTTSANTPTVASLTTPVTSPGINPTPTASLSNATATTSSSASAVPRFEAANPCPYTLPAGQTLNQTVRCGYVVVPELHSQPSNGRTIKLGVVVFKSTSPNPVPIPIVYLEGGPGGHIQSIIDLMKGQFYQTFTARADAIFFDQRGAGNSQPSLYCPEILAQDEKDATGILSPQLSAQHSTDAALLCHDRLAKQGVNFNAYNSEESAADVNDIRAVLGYQKVDVYGGSYGTLLAQTVMRLYPQIIDSVVLDSVVPPDANPDINAIASGSRTLNLVFQACAADVACNRSYPDLKNVFSKTVAQLNANPPVVKVTVPGASSNQTINAKIDGSRFVSAVFQLLYSKQTLELLPQIFYNAYRGNPVVLGTLMSVLLESDQEVDLGMYFSVECSEEWPFSTLADNQQAAKNALPELSQDSAISVQSSLALCQKWNVTKADPAQVSLVKSSLPTLVMEGQLDPITPPEYGQHVAQNLTNSFYVEFPASGHVEVEPDNSCGMSMMAAFFANPATKPDSSCTASLQLNFP